MLKEVVGDGFDYPPCNDDEGDSAVAITFRFDTVEKCLAFAKEMDANVPGFTGRHVYYDWKPILEKRGAAHPLMDPFKMECNKHIEYSEDMCQKSLEIMKRCAHIFINPDWTGKKSIPLQKKLKRQQNNHRIIM